MNAEQDLALKDDQVSTEENQPEQETVVSEEINQSADFPETVTVDAADLVGEAKANQESFVRESKVSVTAQSNLPSQGYYTYSQKTEVKNEPSASAPVAPTIIKSAFSLSGISRARSVFGLPNSITCLILVNPLSRACFS